MFAGHYSAAFAAKAAEPRAPLWALLAAAQFVDILWGAFILTGIEQARLDPSLASNPLDLIYMPYTHSLVATLVWSAVAFVLATRLLGFARGAALAVAATVASHWFLDWVVHRPDLTLGFDGAKLGLALWNHPIAAYALEVVLIAATMWLCVRACGITGRELQAWLGLAVVLVGLQTATTFGPLPVSLTSHDRLGAGGLSHRSVARRARRKEGPPMKLRLFAILAVAVLLPGIAGADCSGDCSTELLSTPKNVEKYVKKAWKTLASCAKRGEPACPTACTLPDATLEPYSLGASCAALIDCELQAQAVDVYTAAWDGALGCSLAAADTCGNARSAAGKLTSTKLKRRRTSKMDKFPDDRAACVEKVNAAGACDGDTVCASAGDWIDAVVPLRLTKGGYQTLPISAATAGEGSAVLTLSAETADWGIADRESVVVQYDVDGTPFGTIVVGEGETTADYRVMLGNLAAGAHTIGLRHSKKLSPAADASVVLHAPVALTVLAPTDPGYDALRFAPVLLGIDRELNVISTHPGNAVSDVPLIEYVRAEPGVGNTTYYYTMIWSNEDGGTGLYPDVLFSQWGRTTDIEGILEVDVADGGALQEVRFRPDESGSLTVFTGAFFGTHPVIRTASQNGLIAEDGDSTLRFLLAPFEFDDSGVARERGMDLDPSSYRIMAKEMIRELKTEDVPTPATKLLSDQRNYLFVEYDIDVDVSGRVLRAYAVVDGLSYASDHFLLAGGPLNPKVSDGTARTAIELPPGTTLADVTEVGMQGVVAMSGTLYGLDAFMLDADFLPGAHTTFSGSLFATGATPKWTVSRSGAIGRSHDDPKARMAPPSRHLGAGGGARDPVVDSLLPLRENRQRAGTAGHADGGSFGYHARVSGDDARARRLGRGGAVGGDHQHRGSSRPSQP